MSEQSIISKYWECDGKCKGNDKKTRNERGKHILKMILANNAKTETRFSEQNELQNFISINIDVEKEDNLPHIVTIINEQLEELGVLFHEDEQVVYSIHTLIVGNKEEKLTSESLEKLLKLGNERNEINQKVVTKIEHIEDLIKYAVPESGESYLDNNPDIVQLKKLWTNISGKSQVDDKIINSFKTLKEIVSITQSLEKNHETVLQVLEAVEMQWNG